MDYTVTPIGILNAPVQLNAYGNTVHSAMVFRLPGVFYKQLYAYGTITIASVCQSPNDSCTHFHKRWYKHYATTGDPLHHIASSQQYKQGHLSKIRDRSAITIIYYRNLNCCEVVGLR